MADDDIGPFGPRPFSTLPDRPPLREVRKDLQPATIETEIADAAARAQHNMTLARCDAIIAVEKARERAGRPLHEWTILESEAIHAIIDLLRQIQAQK